MKTKNIKYSKNEIFEKRIYTKLRNGKSYNSYFVFFVPFRFSLILVFFVLFRFSLISQTPGEWTWMHGDSAPNSPGVFGIQGISNPANTPPAVYEPCEWTDNNGNFWLFGGRNSTTSSVYAALWKFDPNPTNPNYNQWRWMKGPFASNQPGVYGIQGFPSSVNYPGARMAAATWVDDSGNLWLCGGAGYDAFGAYNFLNDLWKYDIVANEWTWMKGPNIINSPGSYGMQGVSNANNLPPSRCETSCSWTDNADNFWLYGGVDYNFQSYGDLWKYDIAANEWTWMHGANTLNPPAVYGTQGLAALGNTPGGRWVYSSWNDLGGNLYLFGGKKVNVTNDLWKYNIFANQWTWTNGPNTPNDIGNYGTKCVSAITNMPPARLESRARVRDGCGNFWIFGGNDSGWLNDLWHYNVSTNQWMWVSGDNIPNQAAVYGTQGVSIPANKPSAKNGSVAWMDNKGYIWVFGGGGVGGRYNDLFRYVPDTACVPVCNPALSSIVTYTNIFCNGQCNGTATVTPSNGISPYTFSWTPNGGTNVTAAGLCAGTYTVTVADAASTTTTATVAITQPPAITTITNSTAAPNGTANVSPFGGTPPYTYLWGAAPLQNTQTATGLAAGVYCCTITDSNNCSDTACVTVTIEPIDCSNLGEIYLPNAFSPNGDGENDQLQIYYGNIFCIKTFNLVIYNRWGEKVLETTSSASQWDGSFRGKIESTAVFVYYMKAALFSGQEIIKKGNISLVR